MKSILVAALVLTSVQAFASKARILALQGADHLVDSQTIFQNPAHVHLLGTYITFEMGATGAGAEGGVLRNVGDAKLGVYLGHQNTTTTYFPTVAGDLRTANTYITQNNPVEVTYGVGKMAFAVSLSNVDNKKAKTKETSVVAKYGVLLDGASVYAHLTAISAAEKSNTVSGNDKLTTAPGVTVGGDMDRGDMRYFGQISMTNSKLETAGTTPTSSDIKDQNLKIGLLDRSLKTKESDIYYGAAILYSVRDTSGKKLTANALPVFLGIEHTLNTWAIFRASVQQNLLFGSTKDENVTAPTSTDPDGIGNNTSVASGLGLKYGQLTLDGTLAAATSGAVNGTAFLTQASVTYNF